MKINPLTKLKNLQLITLIMLAFIVTNCSKSDDDTIDEIVKPPEEEEEVITPCTSQFYEEKDGLVVVEFETGLNKKDWSVKTDISGYSGESYIIWTWVDYFNIPGSAIITYPIKITNPGTYKFIWRSRIANGTNGTEHNDTWLRFATASDFYGKKGEHIVYPKGTGKTPVPNGAGSNGWFKVYMNKASEWHWGSYTSDNDSHEIYVKFDTAGTYNMEISARSKHHALDKFVLFKDNVSRENAISSTATASKIVCN